jgi:Na+/H+ antiporter NhaC
MGSVNEVVNLTLSILPASMVLPGLFLAAAVISLSIGTSVGTIVALMPIAVGIAQILYEPLGFTAAIVVGGAFFGDNLSFISDTTVCATQSQGCRMSDKFRTNIRIAAPAAIIAFVVYAFMSHSVENANTVPPVNPFKVLPYLVVLVTAIMGLNVLIVLVIGTMLCGIIGMLYGDYSFISWMMVMGKGIMGMGELIIVTMLAGGVLETIRANGGIRYLMNRIMRHVSSPRSA